MSQTNSFNTNSYNNVWNNCNFSDEQSHILAWLSPLEPRLRHQDIQDRRVEDVGEWFLQREEFRRWRTSSGGRECDDAVLFCYGDPGVGKTYISSLVIDDLCDQARGQNVAVACFYFDFAVQTEQSSTSMLGALLKQVVGGLGEVPQEIRQAYEDQKKVIGGRAPRLSDIVKMLQTTSTAKRTFICIDALDECAAEYRVRLLNSLGQIIEKSPGTRIFATGRPHIQEEVEKRLFGGVMTIRITTSRDDIIKYHHNRLDEDTTPDAMDSNLEEDILRKIPEDISEIFLLVSLNIDAILQETTIHQRRQKLNTMTDGLGLGGAYDATLSRIKGQDGRKAKLGMAALMWISHAERPLKSDELCHALAVEIGLPNFNSDNVPSIGTLLACCQGLVVVDREATTFRLIHFTLHEYLRAHPELFSTAHSTIAETCLSYLNSQQVKALSIDPTPDLQNTPFLEYSSMYWGLHVQRELSDCAKLLALKLFDDYNNHLPARILLQAQEVYASEVNFRELSLFNGLHWAAIFGITEIVAGLIEAEGYDINQSDCVGNAPLMWAAYKGHKEVVKLLLGQDDVNPDKPDRFGRTPLMQAACHGHEEVVKILLGREDVNPDKTDRHDGTPLFRAAHNGHKNVMKILLGRDDVNPNKLYKFGETPLSCAAYNRDEEAMKILLGRDDIDPNKRGRGGRTPLSSAAEDGHEEVVKILLGQGNIKPDKPDKHGRSPLWWAAHDGREGVVKILLGRGDVNPQKRNKYGQTPLGQAARNGHGGVAKILLGRDDVDPDKPNNRGETPLLCAAGNGHEEVVKILLERDDVDPDKADGGGETPLSMAAYNGHEEVVKMLLGRNSVNPNRPDKKGGTPLLWAAHNGHEGVVKVLIGQDDIDPDMQDDDGRTPLSCAAGNGHMGVMALPQPPKPPTHNPT